MSFCASIILSLGFGARMSVCSCAGKGRERLRRDGKKGLKSGQGRRLGKKKRRDNRKEK